MNSSFAVPLATTNSTSRVSPRLPAAGIAPTTRAWGNAEAIHIGTIAAEIGIVDGDHIFCTGSCRKSQLCIHAVGSGGIGNQSTLIVAHLKDAQEFRTDAGP